MKPSRRTALVVDDDEFFVRPYVRALVEAGFITKYVETATAAIHALNKRVPDLLVVDVVMPPGRLLDNRQTAGGEETGIVIARRLRRLSAKTLIVALTSARPSKNWLPDDRRFVVLRKGLVSPSELVDFVTARTSHAKPRIFIVHGRDHRPLRALNQLLSQLGYPTPMTLSALPSGGLTILEKLEKYADLADVVLVLMTGDDVGELRESRKRLKSRARINVSFEAGYFLGLLGRTSGRVIVLSTQEVDKGSDLGGFVWIDISNGIEAAADEIQRELKAVAWRAKRPKRPASE